MLKPCHRSFVDGTSLQGTIRATYEHLVAAFGEPREGSPDGKTDAEWCLSDGSLVATVYNWKNGQAWCGPDAPKVEDITEWNVGGKGFGAVQAVVKALGEVRTPSGRY